MEIQGEVRMIFDSEINGFIKKIELQRDNYKSGGEVKYTEGQIRNIYDNLLRDIHEINTTGCLDVSKYYKE